MLIRHMPKENNDWPECKIYRYWCNCLCPSHVLELEFWGDDLTLRVVIYPQPTLWRRIKAAFAVLSGKEYYDKDFVVDREDRKELAKIIKS